MPCRLPLLYRLVVSLSKKLDFSLFSSDSTSCFFCRGKNHSPSARRRINRSRWEAPAKGQRRRPPGRPGGKGTASALSFQRPLSAIIRREKSPFCNNIFSFSQTIAIKTSLSPPSAGKTSGPPKKEKPIALPRLAFPHGTPDAIRTHGLPLRRRTLYPSELRGHRHFYFIL